MEQLRSREIDGMWTVVQGEHDLAALYEALNEFHDSTLREAHLWRDTFIDGSGAMHGASKADVHARLLFHIQRIKDVDAVELWFERVTRLQVVEIPENSPQYMVDGTLLWREGLFYWSDLESWTPETADPNGPSSAAGRPLVLPMVVAARGLRWRRIPEWIGPALRYGTTAS
jgi:hypothetical protein